MLWYWPPVAAVPKKLDGVAPVRGCDEEPEETSTVSAISLPGDESASLPMNEACPGPSSPTRLCKGGSADQEQGCALDPSPCCEDSEDSSVDCVDGKFCLFCGESCKKVKRCKGCKGGCYCSRRCRDIHVSLPSHQEFCIPIQQLQEYERDKKVCSVRETVQVLHQSKLIRLVGKRAVVNCLLGTKEVKALWDTGAMVCMIDKAWLEQNLPQEKVLAISEFLEGDELHLVTANNSIMSVEGVVVLDFSLGSISVPVPFVVSSDKMSQPIIGYNVIEELARLHREHLPLALRNSIPSLSLPNAHAVVNLVSAELPEVKHAKTLSKTVLPPHSRCKIRCHTNFQTADDKQSVLFSPNLLDSELEFTESVAQVKRGKPIVNIVVSNPTNQSYVLRKGLVLGSVEAVSAVIPLMPRRSKRETRKTAAVKQVGVDGDASAESSVGCDGGECGTEKSNNGGAECSDGGIIERSEDGGINERSEHGGVGSWLPDVDLSHLSDDQRSMAEAMLREECGAFCRDKSDHGDVPDLQMDLKLSDNVPVVVAHRRIPRPLYEEVKNFINIWW